MKSNIPKYITNPYDAPGQLLAPQQHPVSLEQKKHNNCFQRTLVKYPEPATFLTRAHFYQAVLLEIDPSVTTYIPRPFHLRYGQRHIVPDFFIVQAGQRTIVQMISPRHKDEAMLQALESFFHHHGVDVRYINTQDVLNQEVTAQNGLKVLSLLRAHLHLNTDTQELDIMERLRLEPQPLSALVDIADRQTTLANEVALFRLVIGGTVHAPLHLPLTYDTVFSLCPAHGVTH